jgi:dGTP triphosphohydrolase
MDTFNFALYKNCLAQLATLDSTAIRLQPEEQDQDAPYFPVISPYQIDAAQKIGTSKAKRRMQEKTAVFTLEPKSVSNGGKKTRLRNLHVRTRLSHSLDVENFATALATILGLNVSLALSGASGHDLGHTPFGHQGESFVRMQTGKKFEHSHFGTVVAERVERGGRGLNLTIQTLQCIANHSRGKGRLTGMRDVSPEANVVMLADKVSFIFVDADDVFHKLKLFPDEQRILELLQYFGHNQRSRNLRVLQAIVRESAEVGFPSFEHCEEAEVFHELKTLMYDNIYLKLNRDELQAMLENALQVIPRFRLCEGIDPLLIIALMTDLEALQFTNDGDAVTEDDFANFSVAEIIGDSREALERIRMADLLQIV